MKTKKRKVMNLLTAILTLTLMLALTGCGGVSKDKAIEEIKGVDLEAYMLEDQESVKSLKEAYTKSLEKAKKDEVKDILDDFNSELKTYATRDEKIETYKELVLKEAGDKKDEAEKILAEYEDNLKGVKSNAELDALASEINKKISDKAGVAVNVSASKVETSTPAAKEVAKQTKSNSSGKTSSSSGSSRSSSKPEKQKVWVVDKAAWTETLYRTETYNYSCYHTSDGLYFNTYDEAYAYYSQKLDDGEPINFGPVTRTGTRQVPYTVDHPEEGHWEYR